MSRHKTGVRYGAVNLDGESVTRVAEFEDSLDAKAFAEWWEDERDRPTAVFTMTEQVEQ